MANVPASIITRNVADFAKETGNVYESIAIISKRANQISVKIKEELNSKLAEFATTVDKTYYSGSRRIPGRQSNVPHAGRRGRNFFVVKRDASA